MVQDGRITLSLHIRDKAHVTHACQLSRFLKNNEGD